MDRLSEILIRFSMNAQVFFSGNLCGITPFGASDNSEGHLHLLKSGKLTLIDDQGEKTVFDRPTVIFFPQASHHRIITSESDQAELVCANIQYRDGFNNPLAKALPKFIFFDIENSEYLGETANWLFDEAFNERCGRQPMIDRLSDIFLIQVLRQVLEDGAVAHGMLAGLSHPQLSKVMMSIHEQPEKNWNLESLSKLAAMSRSKFAELFKEVVGQPPGDYLTDWRLFIAQGLLQKNKSVGLVANEVGYENGSALARVFRKKTGLSPKEWLNKFTGSS
ncbi:MAG: AraC family transcriptional regulator [Oleispira antarctica]|nr:AraC family transcriptional regulator [Oleispira antarctica]MBQ0791572.1 AraC family transcriptional regulator [Oleispira antarctica]